MYSDVLVFPGMGSMVPQGLGGELAAGRSVIVVLHFVLQISFDCGMHLLNPFWRLVET